MELVKIAITAALTGLITWLLTRRKHNAEIKVSEVNTIETATKIWRELAQELKKEVDELRTIVDELKEENQKLKQEVYSLQKSNY
jgi:predicted RNase H-like nuclease (RuvC/YqgF family)